MNKSDNTERKNILIWFYMMQAHVTAGPVWEKVSLPMQERRNVFSKKTLSAKKIEVFSNKNNIILKCCPVNQGYFL